MKEIYTADQMQDELKRLEKENAKLKIALEKCRPSSKPASALGRSRNTATTTSKTPTKTAQAENGGSINGEPYAKRKEAIKKLEVHAPRVSGEPGYLPISKPTLKKERLLAGFTREQVAKRMGVSLGWLIELERGRRALFIPVLKNFRRALRQLTKENNTK